ncbi:MAG: hypothetical protein ACKOOI_11545, partial [Pirellula sp.]
METNASLGSVTVDSGATLYPAQGDTFYSQVTLGAGGSIHAYLETSKMNIGALQLNDQSAVDLRIDATTGNVKNASIYTTTANLDGVLNLIGSSKISKYEQLPLVMGNLSGAFDSISQPTSVENQNTLSVVSTPIGLVANGRFLFVNSTGDSGIGTLRDAISKANQDVGLDHIYFDLPSSTTQQISPTSDLPTITNPVYLHGLYAVDQNSYKNAPWVALDGSQINGFSTGLRFDSNNSTLQALSLTGFGYATILSGNQNQLLGNYFGIRPDGSFGANQVAVGVFGSNNQIGSGFTQDRNFIAASQSVGISLSDPNAHSNRIFGNWIGLGPGGNSPEAQGNGVSIYGASNNYIGTNGDSLNDDAEGNVISGNSSGIELINAHNNRISGNRIGTTPDGSSRLQNIS